MREKQSIAALNTFPLFFFTELKIETLELNEKKSEVG